MNDMTELFPDTETEVPFHINVLGGFRSALGAQN